MLQLLLHTDELLVDVNEKTVKLNGDQWKQLNLHRALADFLVRNLWAESALVPESVC